jgi:hypothetical protein
MVAAEALRAEVVGHAEAAMAIDAAAPARRGRPHVAQQQVEGGCRRARRGAACACADGTPAPRCRPRPAGDQSGSGRRPQVHREPLRGHGMAVLEPGIADHLVGHAGELARRRAAQSVLQSVLRTRSSGARRRRPGRRRASRRPRSPPAQRAAGSGSGGRRGPWAGRRRAPGRRRVMAQSLARTGAAGGFGRRGPLKVRSGGNSKTIMIRRAGPPQRRRSPRPGR